MARAAWPWTLVAVLAAALFTATVATTALILVVRGLSRLGKSTRKSAASYSVRLSSNGLGAGREPSRTLDGNNRDEASPRRRTTHRRPPP